jgi:hypothetical protein
MISFKRIVKTILIEVPLERPYIFFPDLIQFEGKSGPD